SSWSATTRRSSRRPPPRRSPRRDRARARPRRTVALEGGIAMYGADDPRSRLSTASKSDSSNASAFGVSTYARFYETEPQLENEHERTWYARGQNFLVAYSEVRAGARLARENQLDEYVLLLPDEGIEAKVRANDETRVVSGYSITFVPPGDSGVGVGSDGRDRKRGRSG